MAHRIPTRYIEVTNDYIEETVEEVVEFFNQDKIAAAVASGRFSYHDFVDVVEAKYPNFLCRRIKPRRDGNFDEYVEMILRSINNVGICHIFSNPFDIENRRNVVSEARRKAIRGGLVGSVVGLGFLLNWTFTGKKPDIEVYDQIVVASAVILPVAHADYSLNRGMKTSFKNLRTAAGVTDNFLRNIKYYMENAHLMYHPQCFD